MNKNSGNNKGEHSNIIEEKNIKAGSGGPKLKKKLKKMVGPCGGLQGGSRGGSRGVVQGGVQGGDQGGHGRAIFFEKIRFRKNTAEWVAGVLARIFHPPTRG